MMIFGELVKDTFVCQPQVTINVKEKGELQVWFVTAGRLTKAGRGKEYTMD